MKPIVSIDPGLRACGCAFFADGHLVGAKLVRNTEKTARGPQAHLKMAIEVGKWAFDFRKTTQITLVLEYPRIYPQAHLRKGDQNDLLELAGVDGAIAAWLIPDDLRHYYPSDWKGQVPKEIMTERIKGKILPNEKQFVKSTDHNTYDAIGIGLKFLNRL